MMIAETILVLTGVAFVLLMTTLTVMRWRGRIEERWPEWAANAIGSGCLAAYWILKGDWGSWLAVSAITALGSAWMWWRWWRRRKRKHATALLGEKSRALRDALVNTMRRERRPSRVLRPHPVPS